ncbi:MAG: bifunctional (p)ppGpp synthetase/guanosine-3',5'-bis(diphosphate) 3'-pyrophosphohydrolase [Lachnospiraceae bacterium]|nr:bifunctional (p)ppGpp synthetase/guanosine-3',5'-bis(diphosphate) 3'-pyrophosphohydrolase [Lachnospiraceae bacterium]
MEEMKTQEQVHNSVVIDDGRIEALDEFLAPEQLYNDLITRVRKYHPSGDISLIEKAYNVANDAHKGQTRKSGEPYIIHPLYVAIILADLELDKETIVAGLLHDVVEDTVMTIDEIKTEFGDDVALLVDGVTKLQMQMDDANLDYSAIKLEMQAENLRKMFLAMAKDIRVILIKLADRLHNMRTLKHMPPEKQQRIARETLDIYSPIAMRLGISKIKVELDDLSLKYLQPEIYYDLANQIAEKKSERENYIQEIVDEVSEHIRAAGIEAKIDGRVKHFFSIYKKMKNQGKTLDQIYDLFAVRIIVDSVKDCYACLGVIHEIYKPIPGRFKDYIAMPKENMYQSLHTTLIGSKGQPFEIQIRTFEMHKAAEYGIAAHWKYKEASDGKRPEQGEEEKLDWLKRILEWQKDMSDNNEFMNSLKSDLNLFSDNVYCFTPTGEVKNLPAGSTPVDFAYSIHSAVGNRMVGARVNGRLVTIDYEIKNGDRIEVITSQNSKGPSRDWLKIAKSAQAKNKINQWFKQELKEDNITKGKELLMSFCKAKNIDTAIVTNPDYMQAIMDKYNFRDWDGILAAVGHGGLKEGQIVNKMVELYEKDHPRQLTDDEIIASVGEHAMKHPHTSGSKSGIVVKGIEDVAVRFSKCCSPVPGDEIVGFVTRGRGISIHRNDCINILNLSENDRSRLIDAEWQVNGDKLNDKYLADIRIYADDRPGLLGDVSRVFTERGITIITLNSHMGKNRVATMTMSFEISGRDELKSIADKLRNIDGIIDIERSTG